MAGLQNIGGIALVIWGIIILVYPDLNAFNLESKTVNKAWTLEQKSAMKLQVFNSSRYLQSINRDTADLVIICYVDKYAEIYSVNDYN